MNINYKYSIKLIITVVLMWSCSLQAQEPVDETKPPMSPSVRDWLKNGELPGNLQFQGFASQAYIATSDNDVFGNTDDGGSFGFTEAGLNALMRPMSRLQLSAQVLSRRAGKGNSATPRLDFGFADFRLYSHEANQFGVRLGRLKNPFGFYNDTRDVAFTRPSILLPQSIYFDRTRNLGLSADAVHFYTDLSHTDLGSIAIQFGLIRPLVRDKDTEAAVIGLGRAGDLTSTLSYIGRGIYETNDKRIRLAVSGSQTNVGYDPALNDRLGPGTIQFTPIYFSAEYNAEKWSLTSEYALRHFKIRNFDAPGLNDTDFSGESYYFQGVYRFNTKWEGVLRYDVLYSDKSDRSGKAFAAKSGRPAHNRFAKDITVGLRFNVTPTFMLRAEYHRVNGTAWLSTLDNPNSSATSQHWNLFAVQASYRF